MDIVTILILPVMSMDIHPFICLLQFFISVLWFSVYTSFISLVKCILIYFIFFWCNCKRDYFEISLSGSLLLIYRQATAFGILILYPATLLDLIISSDNFFGRVFKILYIVCIMCIYIVLSANRNSFLFCLFDWIHFTFFALLL